MNECEATGFNRRHAVGAALATAAGLATRSGVSAAPIRGRALTQRGMVGGGTMALPEGEAVFSVFASRLTVFGEETDIVVGSVQWVDFPSGLTLNSVTITGYKNVPSDAAEVRHISGTMSVNGEGEYPFEMEVSDAGDPGNGADSVSLRVGVSVEGAATATPSAGFLFDYLAEGLITGDVHDVDFDFDLDAGTGVVAAAEAE